MIKMAVPKGNLENGSLEIFEKAGLKINIQPRKHEASIAGDLFSKIIFTRSKRIPVLLERPGGYDLGICGQDCLAESESSVQEIMKLNFNLATTGSVKIVLFATANDPIQNVSEIKNGTKILTEYPKITKKFFDNLGIKVNLVFSEGSTESDIPDGYRFGVCVTETGKSLVANGLRIVAEIFESSSVLVASKKAMQNKKKREKIYIIKKLLSSVLDAKDSVLVMFNIDGDKRDKILKIVPSLKRPTISPLFGSNAFAITAVINKKEVNSVMIKALQAGAEDWIEMPISRLVQDW
jgi:ATP phosphoribosyltransferase